MGPAVPVTGYSGSHACKALAIAGYLPIVYKNLSRGATACSALGPCAGRSS